MDKSISERLYQYRKANGFSQEELAEKIGVSRQAISKWERGESSPDTDNLIALSRLYQITIDELINSEPKVKATEPQPESSPLPTGNAEAVTADEAVVTPFTAVNDNKSFTYAPTENTESVKKSQRKRIWLNAGIWWTAILLFFIFGACTAGGWATSWLFILMAPVVISAISAWRNKNPNEFIYPLFIVIIYIILGMKFRLWHPSWILFITIPLYYTITTAYSKSKTESEAQAPFEDAAKSSLPLKLIAIVIGAALIIAPLTLVIKSLPFTSPSIHNIDKNYTQAIGETAVRDIDALSIDWVSGTIDINEYDGEEIKFYEEEQKNPEHRMYYTVKDGTLKINFCKDEKINSIFENFKNKRLTVNVPKNTLNKLDINATSGDITVNAENISVVTIDTTSGNIMLSGTFQSLNTDSTSGDVTLNGTFQSLNTDTTSGNITLSGTFQSLKTDTTSGDVTVDLPESIPGFSVDYDTGSGDFFCSDFAVTKTDSGRVYGDGSIKITADSTSGDLTIK